MMMAAKTRKPKAIPKITKSRKSKPKKDSTPSWVGHEDMSASKYAKHFRDAMQYYNLNFSGKELKPKVIDWMGANGYPKKVITSFKKTHDWRVSATMGGIAANLLKGMPSSREDFNHGRDVAEWLTESIERVISQGTNDKVSNKKDTNNMSKVSIQDRLRDVANRMTDDFETEYETLLQNPTKYQLKNFNALRILKEKEAKAAHARIIRNFYKRDLDELTEVMEGNDPELKEAYGHLSAAKIKKIHAFLKEIDGACSMILQEGKVARTPRAKKPKSKEKLIEKLNYKKTDEALKLVSINPMDIIGANELWVYNTKTRKIGRYVAASKDPKGLGREGTGLSIKGTTIIGFDEKLSIQKTFRKPAQQVPEFMRCGKVKLRRFLDDIKAVDIKLNGRINKDILLLKVFK